MQGEMCNQHSCTDGQLLCTSAYGNAAMEAVQASLLPASAELYQGDVFQFSTLHNALGDANVMFIATGSRPALDPFGPFQIDYEACFSLASSALTVTWVLLLPKSFS